MREMKQCYYKLRGHLSQVKASVLMKSSRLLGKVEWVNAFSALFIKLMDLQ